MEKNNAKTTTRVSAVDVKSNRDESSDSRLASKTGVIDLKTTQIRAFEELKQRLKEKERQDRVGKKKNLLIEVSSVKPPYQGLSSYQASIELKKRRRRQQ